jgi:CRISPR system Cascade subunit CasC
LKRAYRLGDPMRELDAGLSTRTRRLGLIARDELLQRGVSPKKADKWASAIADQFGSVDKKHELQTSEIVIAGPEEIAAIKKLVEKLAKEDRAPSEEELADLEQVTVALDVAMFGRMRADRKEVSVDAAVQIAHAITTNAVRVEADYWTAVDDLQPRADSGAGGIGEREFASGVFYLYACIDVPALQKNLGDQSAVAADGIEALIRSIATVGPPGHQSSFANRAYAQYLRAEVGDAQPRSLVGAFEQPIKGLKKGTTVESIEALESHAADMDLAYGKVYDAAAVMDVPGKRGSLDEVIQLVRGRLQQG